MLRPMVMGHNLGSESVVHSWLNQWQVAFQREEKEKKKKLRTWGKHTFCLEYERGGRMLILSSPCAFPANLIIHLHAYLLATSPPICCFLSTLFTIPCHFMWVCCLPFALSHHHFTSLLFFVNYIYVCF